MFYIILSIIFSFIFGFIVRGYIIDKNHNTTLINHATDISKFLNESRELKSKIQFLRKRNKLLEQRISALIFMLRNLSDKNISRRKTENTPTTNRKINSTL